MERTISMIDKGDRPIVDVDPIWKSIQQIAKEYKVDLTESAYKVAKARAYMGCPLSVCICDQNDRDRGCISAKCLKEITENGVCHCNVFCKRKG